jgi:glutathione S-transferase
MMFTFYFSPGTSSMAPHIALHEIGASFENRPISLAKKENRTSAYLAINPEGHVPTLLIDGRPLSEVAGIDPLLPCPAFS